MVSFRLPASPAATWPEYLASRAAQAQDARLKRYFSSPWPDPETAVTEVPLVALDMETTGLDPQRDAIVSIGLVPFDQQRIRFSARRYWVLKPPRPLNDKSVTLHRITHSQIANAPDFGEVLDELLQALSGKLVVVHYREIERRFLDGAVQARLNEGIRFPVIDTMALEARLHRLSRWARFRRWIGRPPVSIRLQDSRSRYGLPIYPGHHALTDALATAELFQAQLATHFSPTTPIKKLWC